jgi:hypothetical protein
MIDFTEAMRRVCTENRIDTDAHSLRDLIHDLQAEGKTNIAMTIIFGVSIKTLRG